MRMHRSKRPTACTAETPHSGLSSSSPGKWRFDGCRQLGEPQRRLGIDPELRLVKESRDRLFQLCAAAQAVYDRFRLRAHAGFVHGELCHSQTPAEKAVSIV